MAYFLILIKSLTNISESVLIRKYTDKHTSGSMIFTGVISLFAMLFFLFTDSDGFHPDMEIIPYAIAFGALYCLAYLLTFVALACGPFTLSMLIISYCLVFPIIYGIVWLDEELTILMCIGFLLLAVSLYMVRGTKASDGHGISVKWIISITVVCIGNGGLSIIQKMQQLRFDNAQNHEFMAVSLALSAVLLLLIGTIKDRKKIREVMRCGLPYAGAAGISNGANNYLSLVINNLLPISIFSPISSGVKIVVSYICSGWLFSEHYNRRQIVGVAIGAVAVICLSI